jgi:hypothetical protein
MMASKFKLLKPRICGEGDTLTTQQISMMLFTLKRGKTTLLTAVFIDCIGTIVMFIYADAVSGLVGILLTFLLFLCYQNVSAGKTVVFYLAILFFVLSALDFLLAFKTIGISISATGTVITIGSDFIRCIQAKRDIPKNIDIEKSLTIFEEDMQQRKKEKTFDARAYRKAVRDEMLEMELTYLDRDIGFQG